MHIVFKRDGIYFIANKRYEHSKISDKVPLSLD